MAALASSYSGLPYNSIGSSVEGASGGAGLTRAAGVAKNKNETKKARKKRMEREKSQREEAVKKLGGRNEDVPAGEEFSRHKAGVRGDANHRDDMELDDNIHGSGSGEDEASSNEDKEQREKYLNQGAKEAVGRFATGMDHRPLAALKYYGDMYKAIRTTWADEEAWNKKYPEAVQKINKNLEDDGLEKKTSAFPMDFEAYRADLYDAFSDFAANKKDGKKQMRAVTEFKHFVDWAHKYGIPLQPMFTARTWSEIGDLFALFEKSGKGNDDVKRCLAYLKLPSQSQIDKILAEASSLIELIETPRLTPDELSGNMKRLDKVRKGLTRAGQQSESTNGFFDDVSALTRPDLSKSARKETKTRILQLIPRLGNMSLSSVEESDAESVDLERPRKKSAAAKSIAAKSTFKWDDSVAKLHDPKDGTSPFGTLIAVRGAGRGGYRVIVNAGTHKHPHYRVLPGGDFGSKFCGDMSKIPKYTRGLSKPLGSPEDERNGKDLRTQRDFMQIIAMCQVASYLKHFTRKPPIYLLVQWRKEQSRIEDSDSDSDEGEQEWLTFSELSKVLTAKVVEKQLLPVVLNKWKTAEKNFTEAKARGIHPDTGEKLSKTDKQRMPWLLPHMDTKDFILEKRRARNGFGKKKRQASETDDESDSESEQDERVRGKKSKKSKKKQLVSVSDRESESESESESEQDERVRSKKSKKKQPVRVSESDSESGSESESESEQDERARGKKSRNEKSKKKQPVSVRKSEEDKRVRGKKSRKDHSKKKQPVSNGNDESESEESEL